jgi:hypothetical protein
VKVYILCRESPYPVGCASSIALLPNAVNSPGVCNLYPKKSVLECKNTDSYATIGLTNGELSFGNMSPMRGTESECLAINKTQAGTTVSRISELKRDQV